MFKKIVIIVLGFLFVLISLYGALYFVSPQPPEKFIYGVTFSSIYTKELDLDQKEVYLAILDDLKVKNIRIPIYWPEIESERGEFFFKDYDFFFEEAQKREVKIIPVVGYKLPRWPECFEPEWVKGLNKEGRQERIILMLKKVVERYKDYSGVKIWQIENEPLLGHFGDCPELDKKFLEKEVDLIRSLDQRPVMVTDSGELSTWYRASNLGDYFGTTLYRKVYEENLKFYWTYPIPPSFYWIRANLNGKFPDRIIISELQAEPWVKNPPIRTVSLEEQQKTMNLETFKENLEYAQKTGIPEIYFWGTEWWYWMKEKQNDSGIWDEAQKLF